MSTDRGADARLPTYMTRFVGRGRELALLRQLVGADSAPDGPVTPSRLVTLTGAGGSGKTRLALQLAHSLSGADTQDAPQFHDGVRWVDLAPVTEPEELAHAIVRALGLREAAGRSPVRALVTALRELQLLLVIDNCEHLAEACAQLVPVLLVDCPRVVLLLTSRWSLQVPDETVLVVPPLETVSADDLAGGALRALAGQQRPRVELEPGGREPLGKRPGTLGRRVRHHQRAGRRPTGRCHHSTGR